MIKKVSLGIIELEENKIVTISRKDNHNDFNFVGGKSEENETPYQTLVRETYEEVGIVVDDAILLDVREYNGYEVSTFYVTSIDGMKYDEVIEHLETFDNKGEGKIKYQYYHSVIGEDSSYKEFNRIMINIRQGFLNNDRAYNAFHSKHLYQFLNNFLPKDWKGVINRVMESGVEFSESNDEKWLIGVSDINKTLRFGSTYLETLFKSCLFIAHDCFHNIFGLPKIDDFSEDSLKYFKRSQMSGEVAVLYITEFLLATRLLETPYYNTFLLKRNALQMMLPTYNGVFSKLPTHDDLVTRLDMVIHKDYIDDWVYSTPHSKAFFEDYIPMLEYDRKNIEHNIIIMKESNFLPIQTNTRFSKSMTSDELTRWLVNDFIHTTRTEGFYDTELAEFYRKRRKSVTIPNGWVY